MNSRTSIALIALSLVAGPAAAQSTQAVEWKVSEGGNGHWYVAIQTTMTRDAALQKAAEIAGHLTTITSAAENQFLASRNFPSSGGSYAYWTGGVRQQSGSGSWSWLTGEPWIYSNFDESEPNGCCGGDVRFTVFRTHAGHEGRWDDTSNGTPNYVLIEADADCNEDGVVDYGQIVRGELVDLNSNWIPDVCETSISTVIPPSVPSQGGASVTIRGTGFPSSPEVRIGGVPATGVLRVSNTQINLISPPVLPGLADVSVNSFTLSDGIYIRPECGSDLDQDGEVTAADIAIVLLDFGPCYVTATSPQPDDSKPFMLQEQPAPEAPQSR